MVQAIRTRGFEFHYRGIITPTHSKSITVLIEITRKVRTSRKCSVTKIITFTILIGTVQQIRCTHERILSNATGRKFFDITATTSDTVDLEQSIPIHAIVGSIRLDHIRNFATLAIKDLLVGIGDLATLGTQVTRRSRSGASTECIIGQDAFASRSCAGVIGQEGNIGGNIGTGVSLGGDFIGQSDDFAHIAQVTGIHRFHTGTSTKSSLFCNPVTG
jgi:hypothetical protein